MPPSPPPDQRESRPAPPGTPNPRLDRILGRLANRPFARWILVGALGILFAVFAVAIALQAARLNWASLLLGIAILFPIGGALVALLWYGRVLRGVAAEKAQAEEAARASEEGFRTVAATMADGILTIDEGSRIRYANRAVEQIFGYTSDELLGNELTMLMPDALREEHRQGIRRYLRTGERHVTWNSIQFQGRHKNGTEIPLEISIGEHTVGGRLIFTGIVRDVTERRRAAAAIAASEAKFRELIASAPDGIFVLDPRGTILDVNPAGETLVGRGRAELVGRKLTEFLPPERVPIAERYIADRLEGLRAAELYEGLWLDADGRRIDVQLTSQVARPPEADPYLVLIVRDITERQEMQRKLVESERWGSMGRLASFVAHEINTPLTNISLLTASIARRVSDPEVHERLKKISAQGKIAANITAELLRFARPGAINPVDTDLVGLVRGAVDHAEVFRKKGTEVRTDVGDGPVICPVDPLRIHEVVVNLLKNAYEATPNGRVTVRLEDRGRDVAIAVSDTGIGIPPEMQSRLFEAFFTTKKKGEGTGLGLAISRNFVVSHGGDITVSSAVNQGSTFTILLPRQPPAANQNN